MFNTDLFKQINFFFVWYSGVPFLVGTIMILVELFFIAPERRRYSSLKFCEVKNKKITVVLTAYNDEQSIGQSVADFKNHPFVQRVLVISNNSKDKTIEVAEANGAIAYNEEMQGYGSCVHRALSEGVKFDDTEIVLLCEGDMTFRSIDIDKFLSYIDHVDIVNGTRIVEQLREKVTQLSTFMFYGNYFVGKLLEIKHLGATNLSDVGTTYKLCRKNVLKELLPNLDPKVNLEFNPYFLDVALQNGFKVIECPITFYNRVGVSKGGNISNFVAFKLGVRMIGGIIMGWKEEKE